MSCVSGTTEKTALSALDGPDVRAWGRTFWTAGSRPFLPVRAPAPHGAPLGSEAQLEPGTSFFSFFFYSKFRPCGAL